MATNEEQVKAVVLPLPDGGSMVSLEHESVAMWRDRTLAEIACARINSFIEAAERRGLLRAVQIVQDVADEHVNQDTDAFRELCIVIADLKALAEE